MKSPEHDLPPAPSRRLPWLLFATGLALCILGPAVYVARFNAKHLEMPWYMLISATLGVALMAASVVRRRGIVRTIVLVLFTLVCGFEWYAIGIGALSPAYQGPAVRGNKIPPFTTKLADGQPFSDQDLAKGETTVLVFYRGHW